MEAGSLHRQLIARYRFGPACRQVEVEAIWGEPLRRASAAGAKLPKLEMLYALLKAVCKG